MKFNKTAVIAAALLFMIFSVACDPNVANDSIEAENVITVTETHETEFTIPATELPAMEPSASETENTVSETPGDNNPIDDSNLGEWD